jgi:hypothetical protein
MTNQYVNRWNFDSANYLSALDPTFQDWNIPNVVSYQGIDYRIMETPYFDKESDAFTAFAVSGGIGYLVAWLVDFNALRSVDSDGYRNVCDWDNPFNVIACVDYSDYVAYKRAEAERKIHESIVRRSGIPADKLTVALVG